MTQISRKQREMQKRESQILAVARPILLEEGYQSLSMDRIAAQMEYAKGTIYNHFPNKEEIVMALALESLDLRRRMFEQASLVNPRSRYRMIAIGCACDTYALECQQHFAIEQMLRNSIVWDKSSHERQELIKKYEFRCMAIVAGVVRDAVASQDLVLPTGMSSEEFVFGFWALTYGTHALVQSSPSLLDIGVADPFLSIRYHAYTLMNGYQWQPLIGFEESEKFRESILDTVRCGSTE